MIVRPEAYIFILFLMVISSILVGIYYLFKKTNKGISTEEYVKTLNIPPKLKQIWLKEARKQTGKFLSKQWFCEFWRGERSLVSVFYIWFICLPIAIKLVLISLLYLTFQLIDQSSFIPALQMINSDTMTGANNLSHTGMLVVTCFGMTLTAYYILVAIIMWRCSSHYQNYLVVNWGLKILATLIVIGHFA